MNTDVEWNINFQKTIIKGLLGQAMLLYDWVLVVLCVAQGSHNQNVLTVYSLTESWTDSSTVAIVHILIILISNKFIMLQRY